MTQTDLANIWVKRQEMASTDHPGWRMNNLTTAQRDALTGSGAAKAGDLIWNTTQSALNSYDGSAWQIVGVPGSVGTVTTAATTAVEEYGNAINHFTKLTMTGSALATRPTTPLWALAPSSTLSRPERSSLRI